MNARRLCLWCVAISGSIMLFGVMLRPHLQAQGRTPTDRVMETPADDSGWSALGTGVDGQVQAIAISGNDVYVGGDFTNAGPFAAKRIAKWDGNGWWSMNEGMNGTVHAIVVSNGTVYV